MTGQTRQLPRHDRDKLVAACLLVPVLPVGVLLMVLVGNPWSAVSSAPELLPKPAGRIGQLLPPGAGGNLLRSTAFFNNAAASPHLLVLGTWAVLGLAAVCLGAMRHRSTGATATELTPRWLEVLPPDPRDPDVIRAKALSRAADRRQQVTSK